MRSARHVEDVPYPIARNLFNATQQLDLCPWVLRDSTSRHQLVLVEGVTVEVEQVIWVVLLARADGLGHALDPLCQQLRDVIAGLPEELDLDLAECLLSRLA